jgi:sulfhydrogenase subunit beta (sulfur reductase)
MADARSAVTLDLQGLHDLLRVLREMGFTVLGPTVRIGAVVPRRLARRRR